MIYYLNGLITKEYNEDVLTITISEEKGTPLLSNVPVIIKEYGKYITCICLSGDVMDTHGLIQMFKMFHKAGLKTCFQSDYNDISKINLNILKECDYLILQEKTLKKDYSPFGDMEDWIDV